MDIRTLLDSTPNPSAVEARFWAKVEKTEKCWLWTASLSTYGYGQFGIAGKILRAHRIAWALLRGPIPAGLEVCHECDNPRCLNPDCLFLGTHAENMRDMKQKGRAAAPPALRGEANGASKLTDGQVREIKRACQQGANKRALGRLYGVSDTMIGFIHQGTKWGHVSAA